MPAGNPIDDVQKEFDKITTQEDLAKAIGEDVASIFKIEPGDHLERMRQEFADRMDDKTAQIQLSIEEPADFDQAEDPTKKSEENVDDRLRDIKRQIERLPSEIRDELESG